MWYLSVVGVDLVWQVQCKQNLSRFWNLEDSILTEEKAELRSWAGSRSVPLEDNWQTHYPRKNVAGYSQNFRNVRVGKGLGNHLIYWFPNTCSCGPPCLNVGFSRNIHIFFMWVDFPFSRGSSQTRDQTKPGLLRCRQILYQLSHRGSPRILEWVAYPFSSRSSQLMNQTGVSRIAGRFFTNWPEKSLYGERMTDVS